MEWRGRKQAFQWLPSLIVFLLKNRKTFKGDVMLIGASFNIEIFIILGRRDMALKLHKK